MEASVVLSEDEAWNLLKTTSQIPDSSSSSSQTLINLGKKIAKECGGLPIAIMSIGRALRGKSQDLWQLALDTLQEVRCENVYFKCFKFSFDQISCDESKRCLILCCLFKKGKEICVEDLCRYVFGLGLFSNIGSIKDVMSCVVDLIEELKSYQFLLDGESKGYLKMLDFVRDVVLLIGKRYVVGSDLEINDEFVGGDGVQEIDEWPMDDNLRDYVAISLLDNEIGRLPDRLGCQNLEMLLLSRRAVCSEGFTSSLQQYTDVPDEAFLGLEKLKVLSLTRAVLSLSSLESLTNLKVLELRYCKFTSVGNSSVSLSSLSKLNKLEILSLYGSDVSELPEEIGGLENLKLLELTNCYGLDKITPNVIKRLSMLEELHIGVFEDWDVDGASNASVTEVNSLQNLAILSLAYRAPVPESFVFSNKIGYHLHLCDCELPTFLSRLRYPTVRTICMIATEPIVNSCRELFKNIYNLHLECNSACFKNMIPDICTTGFQELSHLDLYGCEIECLISTTEQQLVAENAFSKLVELQIGMTNLREICDGPPPERFLKNLQSVFISSCDEMNTLFPAKLLLEMEKLERVIVEDCEKLEDVFQLDGLNEATVLFSQLTRLELKNTDALMCIWKGPTHVVNLESLTHLILWNCGNLTSVFSHSLARSLVRLETLDIEDCDQLEYVITELAEDEETEAHPSSFLQNMKEVKIEGCNRLHYVLPTSIAQSLLKFEKITISGAAQLKQVFGNYRESILLDGNRNDSERFSPPIKYEMEDSSNVSYLFSQNGAVVLPSLSHVKIEKCPQLMINSILWVPQKAAAESGEPKVSGDLRIPLETLEINGLTQVEHIIAMGDGDAEHGLSSLKACFQPVCFSCLHKLCVTDCNRMKILLPIKIAVHLSLLTELYVKASNQLVTIFGDEDEADIDTMKEIIFPKLLKLCLEELPNLITFGPGKYHFTFSLLERLRVKACPNMITSFTSAADASVHAFIESQNMSQSEAAETGTIKLIESAQTKVIYSPSCTGNVSDWIRLKRKWISEGAEEGEEEI